MFLFFLRLAPVRFLACVGKTIKLETGASFLISLLIKQCECTQAVIADGMMSWYDVYWHPIDQLERPDDKVLKEEGKAWAEEHKAKKRAKKGADVGNNST